MLIIIVCLGILNFIITETQDKKHNYQNRQKSIQTKTGEIRDDCSR